MRSLSGGAYRLTPAVQPSGRMRRQSGDDVLTRVSPSRKPAIFDHFRPRSKSDSKGKRPTFLANLRNSIFSGRKTSLEEDPLPLEPLQQNFYRQRSGSETRGGTMSKVIDLFRGRSNSLSGGDARGRKSLNSTVPGNANVQIQFLRRHSLDPSRKRRPFPSHRSLDPHQGEGLACHSEDDVIDRIDFSSLGEEIVIPAFLNSRPCYSVMPTSGKVVILSVELLVKNAFGALVINELKSAPLWSSAHFDFVGLLTISDFINVLRHYYYSDPEDIKDIENQKIATWRELTHVEKPFVKVNTMDSLAKATKLLIEEGVHRIPVIDEKRHCVVHVLTKKRLLQYLYNNFIENFDRSTVKTPSFFSKSIQELGVGTFSNIAKVTPKTRVIEALDLFVDRKVSALPIVDDNDVFIDVFGKIDVFALAKAQTYNNLDMTVNEAIDKGGIHEDVYGCAANESLGSVIDKFVLSKARRLVVLDGKKSPAGIVSLSDILKFLVVQPLILHSQSHHAHLVSMEQASSSNADVIDETPEGAMGGDSCVFLEAGDSAPGSSKTPEDPEDSLNHELSKLQVTEDCISLPEEVSGEEMH